MNRRAITCLDDEIIVCWGMAEGVTAKMVNDYVQGCARANREDVMRGRPPAGTHGHIIEGICQHLLGLVADGVATDRELYAMEYGSTWEEYDEAIMTALGCGFIRGYVHPAGG